MKKLLAAACLVALGCAPPQQIYHKEKVYYQQPPRGTRTDDFVFGKAKGPVNIVFVVDNTLTGQAALSGFRQTYDAIIARMSSAEARLVDYRIMVITQPGMRTPGNWIAPDQDSALQRDELFGVTPILSGGESGNDLAPLAALAGGISHKAFESRRDQTTFAVMLSGYDTRYAENTAVALKVLDGTLKTRQAHALTLTRVTAPGAHPQPYPYCGTFTPATRHLETIKSIPWRSYKPIDLCDPAWPQKAAQELGDGIIEYKKRLVLSSLPFEPQTMRLTTPVHERLYRYGEDYHVDAATNEIVFINPPGLLEGDLLSASYFTGPDTELNPKAGQQ